MARFANVHNFERPSLPSLHLRDADGNDRRFFIRSLLLGDQLLLEALELKDDDDSAGHFFQSLGDAGSEPSALLDQLVQKMMRALSTKHLVREAGSLQIAETMVKGRIEENEAETAKQPLLVIDGRRIEWSDFGSMLMKFQGWQFRLELIDPVDEA
jgi:hypothetical protein